VKSEGGYFTTGSFPSVDYKTDFLCDYKNDDLWESISTTDGSGCGADVDCAGKNALTRYADVNGKDDTVAKVGGVEKGVIVPGETKEARSGFAGASMTPVVDVYDVMMNYVASNERHTRNDSWIDCSSSSDIDAEVEKDENKNIQPMVSLSDHSYCVNSKICHPLAITNKIEPLRKPEKKVVKKKAKVVAKNTPAQCAIITPGSTVLYCPICPFESKSAAKLKTHGKLHTMRRGYKSSCSLCLYFSRKAGHLKRHMLSHGREVDRSKKDEEAGACTVVVSGNSDGPVHWREAAGVSDEVEYEVGMSLEKQRLIAEKRGEPWGRRGGGFVRGMGGGELTDATKEKMKIRDSCKLNAFNFHDVIYFS